MEVIAGEPVFDVTVRECGAEFQLNFKEVKAVWANRSVVCCLLLSVGVLTRAPLPQVYWNSRLQHEHKKIVDTMTKDDIVCALTCSPFPFNATPL